MLSFIFPLIGISTTPSSGFRHTVLYTVSLLDAVTHNTSLTADRCQRYGDYTGINLLTSHKRKSGRQYDKKAISRQSISILVQSFVKYISRRSLL